MKVGIVVPVFTDDPHRTVTMAKAADAAGLDGVFVFDHVWPLGGAGRPALHGPTMLGALAASTERVAIGTLVARVGLLPDAVLTNMFVTAAKIAGQGRIIAGLGAGDRFSEPENRAIGVDFPSAAERLDRLEACAVATRDAGVEVWIGGLAPKVRAVAARVADGLNLWGVGPEALRDAVDDLIRDVGGRPFALSWGGQTLIGTDDDDARARHDHHGDRDGLVWGSPERVRAQLAERLDAGAEWVIGGPISWERGESEVELMAEVARGLR